MFPGVEAFSLWVSGLCSGNSLSQTSSSTPFPCSAYVIVILPVSIYLIFINFFFQAELTQSVNSALFEAEGTVLEHKVASREPLTFKAICELSLSLMSILVTLIILQSVGMTSDLMIIVH